MLKHYIEFFKPGVVLTNTTVSEVTDRDISKVEIPNDCYGFRFFDMFETVDEGEIYKYGIKNVSSCYYKGKKITIEQIKEMCKFNRQYNIVLSNMKINNCVEVVKTKFGNFIPLKSNDIVIM